MTITISKVSGMIKTFSRKRDYGFIYSQNLENDIHFHMNDIVGGKRPREGQSVTFDIGSGDFGRPIAKNVVLAEDDEAEGERAAVAAVDRTTSATGVEGQPCVQIPGRPRQYMPYKTIEFSKGTVWYPGCAAERF